MYNRIIKEDSVIITRQNTERSSNFEMLRIIAMFMIVAAHYAGHGVRHVLFFSESKIWLTGSFINRIFTSFLIPGGKIGVGLFFALTGYFMIDKEYKIQRLLKIILEVYFYSILMIIIWGGTNVWYIQFPIYEQQ